MVVVCIGFSGVRLFGPETGGGFFDGGAVLFSNLFETLIVGVLVHGFRFYFKNIE